MKIEIYVPDEYQKKYDEAIAKLKEDKYKDKLTKEEKDMLELDVARIVTLERLKQDMVNIAEGQSPFDLFSDENFDAFYKELTKMVN